MPGPAFAQARAVAFQGIAADDPDGRPAQVRQAHPPAAGQPRTKRIGENKTLVKLPTPLGTGRQGSLLTVEKTVGVAAGGDAI